eukprot:gene7644-1365_t
MALPDITSANSSKSGSYCSQCATYVCYTEVSAAVPLGLHLVDSPDGPVVEAVHGPLADAGLRPGDLVTHWGDAEVTSVDMVRDLKAHTADHTVLALQYARCLAPDLGTPYSASPPKSLHMTPSMLTFASGLGAAAPPPDGAPAPSHGDSAKHHATRHSPRHSPVRCKGGSAVPTHLPGQLPPTGDLHLPAVLDAIPANRAAPRAPSPGTKPYPLPAPEVEPGDPFPPQHSDQTGSMSVSNNLRQTLVMDLCGTQDQQADQGDSGLADSTQTIAVVDHTASISSGSPAGNRGKNSIQLDLPLHHPEPLLYPGATYPPLSQPPLSSCTQYQTPTPSPGSTQPRVNGAHQHASFSPTKGSAAAPPNTQWFRRGPGTFAARPPRLLICRPVQTNGILCNRMPTGQHRPVNNAVEETRVSQSTLSYLRQHPQLCPRSALSQAEALYYKDLSIKDLAISQAVRHQQLEVMEQELADLESVTDARVALQEAQETEVREKQLQISAMEQTAKDSEATLQRKELELLAEAHELQVVVGDLSYQEADTCLEALQTEEANTRTRLVEEKNHGLTEVLHGWLTTLADVQAQLDQAEAELKHRDQELLVKEEE